MDRIARSMKDQGVYNEIILQYLNCIIIEAICTLNVSICYIS